NLALVAAGMVFLACTSLAQVVPIEGTVKGADGKPIQGAVIKITRTDIRGEYPAKTDKKGHYINIGVPIGGTFNVALFIDGKQVDVVNGVRTGGEMKPVDFDLKAAQKDNSTKQAELQKAMETTGKVPDDIARGMSAEQKAQMEKDFKDKSEKMKKRNELNDSFNAGIAAKEAKNWDLAVASFAKSSELDPSQPAVWANLGESYGKLAETKTGPDFDATIQKALEAYSKAIELKPDDAASHNNYAIALGKAKKFPEMQAELKKAADLDPPNGGKYYYNLGAMLVNANQAEAAGEAFKKAIELTPTYADAYYQYGVTLVGKAQIGADGKVTPVAGTVEAFQKYLDLAPTGPYAQSSKDMLATLGSTVDVKFTNPNAKTDNKKSTTTKKKQ
ncbi:MAG TPA: tetratricopeptide repeat protein, partial [Bryobacteraceae bacterium]|nr:tetratricopeptide repeat protein [Bryobacteraceae bacterium]